MQYFLKNRTIPEQFVYSTRPIHPKLDQLVALTLPAYLWDWYDFLSDLCIAKGTMPFEQILLNDLDEGAPHFHCCSAEITIIRNINRIVDRCRLAANVNEIDIGILLDKKLDLAPRVGQLLTNEYSAMEKISIKNRNERNISFMLKNFKADKVKKVFPFNADLATAMNERRSWIKDNIEKVKNGDF